jgi:hypothetical protein
LNALASPSNTAPTNGMFATGFVSNSLGGLILGLVQKLV